MKQSALILLMVFTTYFGIAQTLSWNEKAPIPFGKGRYNGVSFGIDGKVYVATGRDNNGNALNDLWEYNPITNTWLQRQPMPAEPRVAAFGFAINGKGYVGGGITEFFEGGVMNTFYEYNPSNNSWSQKKNLEGLGKTEAVSFVIGGKGYVAMGANKKWNAGTKNTIDYSVQAYNPATDTWEQKADFDKALIPRIHSSYQPEGFTKASSFVINDIAYVVGGNITSGSTPCFYTSSIVWKYNPTSDTWTDIGSIKLQGSTNLYYKAGATGFALNGKGYIVGGYVSNSEFCVDTEGNSDDVLEYNPINNVWVKKDLYPGSGNSYLFSTSPCDFKANIGSFSFYELESEAIIQGPTNNVCNSNNNTYHVKNISSGSNVSWTKSSNLTYVSGQNTNNYKVKAQDQNTADNGWVKATITNQCGQIITATKTLWVGKPSYSNSNIFKSGTNQYNFTYSNAAGFYVYKASGATSYRWSITSDQSCGSSYDGPVFYSNGGGTEATTSQNSINVNTGTCDGDFRLICEAVNSCGIIGYSQRLIRVSQSTGGGGGDGGCLTRLNAYPNPTRGGNVTVDLIMPPADCSVFEGEKNSQITVVEEITCIEVIDNFGNPVDVEACDLTTTTINLDGYNNGIYYVNATTNTGNTYQVKLLKN